MKRKPLLAITGCTAKAFETYSSRNFLPIAIGDARWSDYTLKDAFALKVLVHAAKATDLASASVLASGAWNALKYLNPFAFTDAEEIWLGLVRYDWPDAPQGWIKKGVVAGRWCDIQPKADEYVNDLDKTAKITSILLVSASKIADGVFEEARQFAPDEAHPDAAIIKMPEDLTGYPDWLKTAELGRRDFFAKLDPNHPANATPDKGADQ
jgi:hypothetical protein